jgi:hypothetical protein
MTKKLNFPSEVMRWMAHSYRPTGRRHSSFFSDRVSSLPLGTGYSGYTGYSIGRDSSQCATRSASLLLVSSTMRPSGLIATRRLEIRSAPLAVARRGQAHGTVVSRKQTSPTLPCAQLVAECVGPDPRAHAHMRSLSVLGLTHAPKCVRGRSE